MPAYHDMTSAQYFARNKANNQLKMELDDRKSCNESQIYDEVETRNCHSQPNLKSEMNITSGFRARRQLKRTYNLRSSSK